MSDDNGDDEIRAEHHEVLELADVKREAWRNEQKIPQQRAESGENKGRPAAQSHSGEDDCEQVEERDRPVTDKIEDQQREAGNASSDAERDSKLLPGRARQTFFERFTSRPAQPSSDGIM